jgi:hypothetical protein
LITRNREKDENKKSLKDTEKPNFILQTNQDWWEKDPKINLIYSKERNFMITKNLTEHYKNNSTITPLRLWSLLESFPVWNAETIYCSLMIPHLSFCKTIITFKDHQLSEDCKKMLEKDAEKLKNLVK